MAKILSGKVVRESRTHSLKDKVLILKQKLGFVPKFAIVQVGDRADSAAFIRAKISFGKEIGVETVHVHLSEEISESALITEIKKLNEDETINAIIVQLPIPAHLDRNRVVDAIDPKKDADALSGNSVKKWAEDAKKNMVPATPRGVREILSFYNIGLNGKKVTVVGRSELVGRPTALMCQGEGAIVTVCHSKTENIAEKTRNADIVIVAVGKPKFFGEEYFRAGQVVIDIGINTVLGDKLEEEISGRKLVGDVDFDAVKGLVEAITPVPGGVGPMTVLALFENVVDLCNG